MKMAPLKSQSHRPYIPFPFFFIPNSHVFPVYKIEGLIGVSGFAFCNPFIEVINIKVYPPAHLNHWQGSGPDKLTEGGDRPPQVYGSLWNGKKPLFKGFTLGIMNPVRLFNFLFFQTYLPICALTVPIIKASAFNP
jgi:hypothetical protein